jgi:hypothetical protein
LKTATRVKHENFAFLASELFGMKFASFTSRVLEKRAPARESKMNLHLSAANRVYRSRILTAYLAMSFVIALALTGWESFELLGAIALPTLVLLGSWVLFRNSNINWSDLGLSHKPAKTESSLAPQFSAVRRKRIIHVRLAHRWPQRVVSQVHLFEKA